MAPTMGLDDCQQRMRSERYCQNRGAKWQINQPDGEFRVDDVEAMYREGFSCVFTDSAMAICLQMSKPTQQCRCLNFIGYLIDD